MMREGKLRACRGEVAVEAKRTETDKQQMGAPEQQTREEGWGDVDVVR